MLVWLRASSMSPVIAVIASGVSCRFWLRNCAVTITSSSASPFSACCACVAADPSAAMTAIAIFLFIRFPPNNKPLTHDGEPLHGVGGRHVKTHQVETFLHTMRVLAHQRIDASGLPCFDRIDDGVMLSMRVVEPVVHLVELGAVE